MHASLLAAAAAMLASACLPADAPAPAPPLGYDCDTPTARLSELEQVRPGPAYRISGKIRASALLPDERWEAAGNIFVESADEQDRVMLQLIASDREAPLQIVLRTNHGLNNDLRQLGQVALGEEIVFNLTVAGGRAKIEIGAIKAEAPADLGKHARVGVGCAAGTFRFEDLRFGD